MRWKAVAILVVLFVYVLGGGPLLAAQAADAAPVEHAELPPVVPAGRPALGLALEGGGALGIAHIGVLEWLEEHRVPVDRLSGTSMGSLVGALYATGHSPKEIARLALSDAIASVFTLQTPYKDASFRRRQDRREVPQAVTFGLRNPYGLRNSLFSDRGVNEFLIRELFRYNDSKLDYNRLPIPFRCVATDLNTLGPVTFASGPLPQAVRASLSIPGIFPPVKGPDGHYLVDGGILDNLPTGVLRSQLDAGVVIAVHLENSALGSADTSSVVGVLDRAFSAGTASNEARSMKLADVVIDVPVGNFSTTDYRKAGALIAAGYKAAEENRAALARYALDETDWRAYLAAREARQLGRPGVVHEVRVVGGSAGAVRELEHDTRPLRGRRASAAETRAALKGVQADGVYEATYETFAERGQEGALTGILIHLRKDPNGPPFLLVAPEMAASTSNISRGELDMRLVYQDLGGFGSEFRADARLGYMTHLTAEYYRLLTPGGYFVQPEAGLVRTPVYLWAKQKRVAERFQQDLTAGLEAGRTINSHAQIAVIWSARATRWALRTGNGGGPYLSGTAQTGLLRFSLDEAASGAISPRGFRLSAEAGALYHAMASDNAPLMGLTFTSTQTWQQKNILGLGVEAHSYLRARVAEPYRFTLGGPLRLSASSFDEYRGTDTWLARSGYMRRIAALPTGLGQGLYAEVGYEAGEIWSPDARAILRQDGTAALVGSTPLGVITLGVSVGDAGRRKVFFTIGRWF